MTVDKSVVQLLHRLGTTHCLHVAKFRSGIDKLLKTNKSILTYVSWHSFMDRSHIKGSAGFINGTE